MLGYFMSDTIVGIYSFASTFAEGFAQLSTVIRQNVDPIVGKCFAEDNERKDKGDRDKSQAFILSYYGFFWMRARCGFSHSYMAYQIK